MAKIMVTPLPNVLKKFLAAEGKTFEELADTLHMSRATLRRINDGKPVKDETLRNVANHLRKPVSHFVAERPQDASTGQSNAKLVIEHNIGSFTRASILLRRLDGQELRSIQNSRHSIEWTLRVTKLSSEAAEILRTLEGMLTAAPQRNDEIVIQTPGGESEFVITNSSVRSGRTSLSRLIEGVEQAQTFDEQLTKLADEGVFLLGADFLYWSCETREEYYDEGKARRVDEYSSEYRQKIVVQDSSIATMRESVLIGRPPPATIPADGNIVRVDGDELEGSFDIGDYTPF